MPTTISTSTSHSTPYSNSFHSEDERTFTPQFSPSAFFPAIDKFCAGTEDTNPDTWHNDEALLYGEAVSSTQNNQKCIFPPQTPLPSSPLPQYNWQGAAEVVTCNAYLAADDTLHA
ncbi:hypothetical protein DFJ58DRAFT_864292 [Suillus subalutaceus]|uniref:uncharacterized protein n=1 Tax=Suillus subalutaceus TaxID=48586 RepID=UPI001B86862F|nr:uncharacterized protein DFJ58DRAFT_864292 [Suillus subalutaceus]KAG1836798.1 hypothetical protein DFJ58DRAFT_864292 [Suillus subalutaceus]